MYKAQLDLEAPYIQLISHTTLKVLETEAPFLYLICKTLVRLGVSLCSTVFDLLYERQALDLAKCAFLMA